MQRISFSLLAIIVVLAGAYPDGIGIDTSSVFGAAGNVASGLAETGLKGAKTATGVAQAGVDAAKDAANKITSTFKADVQANLPTNVQGLESLLRKSAKQVAGWIAVIQNIPEFAKIVAGNLKGYVSSFISMDELTKLLTKVMTATASSTGIKL